MTKKINLLLTAAPVLFLALLTAALAVMRAGLPEVTALPVTTRGTCCPDTTLPIRSTGKTPTAASLKTESVRKKRFMKAESTDCGETTIVSISPNEKPRNWTGFSATVKTTTGYLKSFTVLLPVSVRWQKEC